MCALGRAWPQSSGAAPEKKSGGIKDWQVEQFTPYVPEGRAECLWRGEPGNLSCWCYLLYLGDIGSPQASPEVLRRRMLTLWLSVVAQRRQMVPVKPKGGPSGAQMTSGGHQTATRQRLLLRCFFVTFCRSSRQGGRCNYDLAMPAHVS